MVANEWDANACGKTRHDAIARLRPSQCNHPFASSDAPLADQGVRVFDNVACLGIRPARYYAALR